MAFASGWEHAVYAGGGGFGLGFLNFLGTVLFIVLVIGFLKALRRRTRWRRSMASGSGEQASSREEWWNEMRSWWETPRSVSPATNAARPHAQVADEAMTEARRRLAEGEIDPEAFAVLRAGLERPTASGMHDDAVATLRLRFARGDIDRATFDTAVDALA